MPILTLGSEPSEVMRKFVHLGSYASAGVIHEINVRTAETREAYDNLRHLRSLCC